MRPASRYPAAALLAACLSACSNGPSGPPPEDVAMILIDPFPGVVMPPSVELRPRLEVLDSMGDLLETPSRSAFRFSSSDASVATVSEDGVIRVRGLATPGARTDIRITYGEAETFLMVSAAEQPVAAKVTPEYTLTPGAQVLLYGVAVNPPGGGRGEPRDDLHHAGRRRHRADVPHRMLSGGQRMHRHRAGHGVALHRRPRPGGGAGRGGWAHGHGDDHCPDRRVRLRDRRRP